MKKRLSLFLVFILFFTNINLNKVYADTSEDEYATLFMAQLYDINAKLSNYGLTLDDLRKLPKKDDDFYKDMKNNLLENTSSPALKATNDVIANLANNDYGDISLYSNSINQKAINASKRWSYAQQIAEINNKRDSNAKDKSKEVVYMYMSHFIDIRDGIKESVDTSISDDLYFSAWITNDDRRVYDTYLKGSKNGNVIKETADLALSIKSLSSTLKDTKALEKAINFSTDLDNLTSIALGANKVKEDFDTFVQVLSESEHSKEAISRIEASLTKKYSDEQFAKDMTNFLTGLAISFALGGFGGVISNIAFSTVSLVLDVYKDFFDRAWWISLVRTNSLRVSYRIMRNQGWL